LTPEDAKAPSAYFGPFFPQKRRVGPRGWYAGHVIRVLVALSPRMYRQAVALAVQRNRPGLVDVRIAPPEEAEAELASLRPHLLVHNDARGDARDGTVRIPEAALPTVREVLERGLITLTDVALYVPET
jgi:hypothetical protein